MHMPGHSEWGNLSLASHDQPGVTSGRACEMAIKRKPPPSSLLLAPFQFLQAAIPETAPRNVLLLTALTLHEATEGEPVNSGDF